MRTVSRMLAVMIRRRCRSRDDLLHAEPGDRGQRVDVVDEELRPLRAPDVVGDLDRAWPRAAARATARRVAAFGAARSAPEIGGRRGRDADLRRGRGRTPR